MQEDQTQQKSLTNLANKIKRLRLKLISYGWNKKQTYNFILYDFMKLPPNNWSKPQTTVSYYQVKQKFKVETEAAELILCLKEIVPNLQCQEVLQYLHTLFDYSSIQFGFDIFQSSSDSSQNPRIMRNRSKGERGSFKRSKPVIGILKGSKKIHREQQKQEIRQNEQGRQIKQEKIKEKDLILVRRRKTQESFGDYQEQQRKLKKGDF